MWQKIKDNWKTYLLLLILSALFGTDQAMEYAAQPETPPGNLPRVEKPAPAPDNTWTVVAWFTAEKTVNQPGLPAFRYSDNMGRYTVFVEAEKQPTTRQIVDAFGKELNPESVTLKVVSVIPPPGWKEPGPGPEEPEEQ